ncbi:glutamine amidotransferase-related protein [Massilia niastensis]|uniref:glutamine amidotransferase-related protein n=1 Tax=Massilia niastensis TaxID=544911 RepID=UPI00038196C8|nr:gamma-glutamyl-gamma-aminobutyrate hydrolase family protein [Massilia niastensis]
MECIAVYHVAFEDLGSFAAPLRERGYGISYRHAGAEPLTPEEWRRADLVVVLGGPIGAGDTALYPWLADELAGIRARLALRRPTLGICLGAQLMAVALGGAIARRSGPGGRPQSEIGWGELALAAPDGVLAGLAGLPVLHWHGDNIVPPPGLAALASTPGTPCQAFALDDYALGLQFHAEFAGRALEAWLTGHAVELAHAGVELARLRADTARHAANLEQGGALLLRRWLDGIDI